VKCRLLLWAMKFNYRCLKISCLWSIGQFMILHNEELCDFYWTSLSIVGVMYNNEEFCLLGMWRCVDLVWIDVSEERIASIFRVEKSMSEKPAWAHGCNSPAHAGSSLADFSTMKTEAICPSETSVHTRSTWRHIPEDRIPHSHHCENLKSYTI
jgi:hypothetical protein